MAYSNRHLARKRVSVSAEFMYLLVVLVAGVMTAWWAGHQLDMNLSTLTTMASVLGIGETKGITRPVGHSQTAAVAPYCLPGQSPTFSTALTGLKQRLGNTMGLPLECEHAAATSSDTIQQTSTGLAAYNGATGIASFTDGWRHWAVTPRGVLAWEGPESEPPAS